MNETFEVTILPVDAPTVNNRIYPKAVLEGAIGEMVDKTPLMVCLDGNKRVDSDGKIDISTVVGTLVGTPRIEGDRLIATVKLLDVPGAARVKQLLDGVKFTASGVGKVDENGIVTDYAFSYINVGPKDE